MIKNKNFKSKTVYVLLGGQRWRLEEEQLFQVHGVDLHHKQQYYAANIGQRNDYKCNININGQSYIHLLQQKLPQTRVGANI